MKTGPKRSANCTRSSPDLTSAPESFRELAEALRERLTVIADRELYARDPAAHLQRLQTASTRIVEIQGQLPAPLDPQLAHYLQRCSYDKALAWLEENA
jgi:hypothetical protein